MTALDTRPSATEHPSYALIYVDAAATALGAATPPTVLGVLAGQAEALRVLTAGVSPETLHRAYAPGKWTLAESLIHMADIERVFAYRMLSIARGDKSALPGMDHDAWVPESRVAHRTRLDILTEIDGVRGATLALVRSLDDVAVQQLGTASGKPVSARALAWMIAGHFAHHLELIRTRYLGEA